jgi:hypothetical protein
LGIGKVSAEHQQRVGLHDGVVAGGKADQTGESHVVGVVELDVFAAAQGGDNGRFEFTCNRHQFLVRAGTARAS